jgi:putative Mg2+ transporter-C (MgtC) family protein
LSAALTWQDAALRIALTVLAGAVIGFERGEKGHTAGLRTTLLVALAACLAMLLANGLMRSVGKPADSFVTFDVMRLPLGILTGVGFIGGGAILRRDTLVIGVTTAATLWFVTVVGLAFGAGQIGLGLGGLILGILILHGLKALETHMPQYRPAKLRIRWNRATLGEAPLLAAIQMPHLQIVTETITYDRENGTGELALTLRWRTRPTDHRPPAPLRELADLDGIVTLTWET